MAKLFSRNVIIKRLPGNRLKAYDVSKSQSDGASSMKYDRYGWHKSRNTVSVTGWGNGFSSAEIEATRKNMYLDYEAMDTDAIISSALDIYADESTTEDATGNMLTITSQNPQIKKILYNLFYDVLNIQHNLWSWVRGACKYGDYVLYLVLKEGIGIINVIPIHPSVVEREEGFDPANPEKYRFRYTGETLNMMNRDYFEEFEVAHIRILTDTNYLPYGRSIIEPARKEYKKLMLLEDAMLLQRIMRAPERRIFKIDIGNIAPEEVDAFMLDFINAMKKVPYIDQATGDYNLKFNLMNMLEDIYLPTRGSDTGTAVETLPGLQNEGQIEDVEYAQSKLFAALKIPKAWLGFDENVEGKATLAAEDIRFARTTMRIQNFIVSELYKMAVTHLYIQGFKSDELMDFELSLSNPSTIFKRQQIDLLNEKMTLVTNMIESNLFSEKYIYERIFDMSEDEWKAERDLVFEDLKNRFRREQISTEGNDPKITGKSFGTPHDLASMQMASSVDGEVAKNMYTQEDGRKDNEGQPPAAGTFGTDRDKAFGRDPDGRKAQDAAIKPSLQAHYIRGLDKFKSIEKTMVLQEGKNKPIEMMDEKSLLDDNE